MCCVLISNIRNLTTIYAEPKCLEHVDSFWLHAILVSYFKRLIQFSWPVEIDHSFGMWSTLIYQTLPFSATIVVLFFSFFIIVVFMFYLPNMLARIMYKSSSCMAGTQTHAYRYQTDSEQQSTARAIYIATICRQRNISKWCVFRAVYILRCCVRWCSMRKFLPPYTFQYG